MAVAKDRLKKILEEENYDPLLEAVALLKAASKPGSVLTTSERLKANLELCSYLYPKMKSIEIDGKIATEFNITVQKFGHLLDEREAIEAAKPVVAIATDTTLIS